MTKSCPVQLEGDPMIVSCRRINYRPKTIGDDCCTIVRLSSDVIVRRDCCPNPVCIVLYVAWWCNGYGVELAIKKLRIPLSRNESGEVVHTHVPYQSCHQAVQFGTGQRALMLGWVTSDLAEVMAAVYMTKSRARWFIT